ncbi:MAG: hypothetical protein WCG08_10775 [Paludibacter sp.]
MKKRIAIYLLLVIFLSVSCEKDEINSINSQQLQGTWTEQTDNSFKYKLKFQSDTMYFFQKDAIDTLFYRLDSNNKMYLFYEKSINRIESQHSLLLNKKANVLTVSNLFPTFDKETITVFDKD